MNKLDIYIGALIFAATKKGMLPNMIEYVKSMLYRQDVKSKLVYEVLNTLEEVNIKNNSNTADLSEKDKELLDDMGIYW